MPESFARLLRQYRVRRRWSQEHLGLEAQVSPRHLSYLETGKAQPSREMVLLVSRVLNLELRERNALLVGAGFAAAYPTSPLESTAMAAVNRAVDLLLSHQEPYGGALVDRSWNVLRVNDGARRLLDAFLGASAAPPHVVSNLVRATLHPDALRPYVVNWKEIATLLVERVEREHQAHPEDDARQALLTEIQGYPEVATLLGNAPPNGAPVAVIHLRHGTTELRVFTLLTTVGTPLDVTAQDLAIESFFPADDATDRWFRRSS